MNVSTAVFTKTGHISSSFTPMHTPRHRPTAVVTHSMGLREGRPSLNEQHIQALPSYVPITPVPINFLLDVKSKTRCSSSRSELETDRNAKTKSFTFSPMGRKISLGDFARKYCTLGRTEDILSNPRLRTVLLDITSENSGSVRFDSYGFPVCFHGQVSSPAIKLKGGVADLREELLKCGCDASLLSDVWISNHRRWIIWKLAAMERKFHSVLAGKYLTYRHLIHQLQKRFEIEIVRALRPAIRKILNRDVSASTCMTLCVSKILDDKEQKGIRIILTDGWYEIPSLIDEHLQDFIRRGKIVVGSKVLVSNAILEGADEGIDPLDSIYRGYVRSFAVRLKLFANCTRLCKWSAKLGFLKPSKSTVSRGGTFGIHQMSDIIPGGGPIPSIDLIICRRYPVLFQEEMRNKSNSERGKRIITEAENAFLEEKFEDECNRFAEEMAEKMQKEESEVRGGISSFYEL
jgi:BRCA2, oligonucleotide/oligosaccharide-binding, domain 1./BRCA2, helical.